MATTRASPNSSLRRTRQVHAASRTRRLLDHVAQRPITRASLGSRPGQNRNGVVDIINDQDVFLVIMLAMQPADILCQGPLPRDRHRQEQCVEPRSTTRFLTNGENLS